MVCNTTTLTFELLYMESLCEKIYYQNSLCMSQDGRVV